jgi:hypothetical protein
VIKKYDILESHPILDSILDQYRTTIGSDFEGYRNHVYRMMNCARFLGAGKDAHELEKIVIAAAFHDIGIWTHKTLDYLKPSVDEAKLFLANSSRSEMIVDVCDFINEHHKLTAIKDPKRILVEIFRRADLADFSLGIMRGNIDPMFFRALKVKFPNSGFHRMLIGKLGMRLFKHPFNLLPMMRW